MRQTEGNGVVVCHCQILKLMHLMYVPRGTTYSHIIDYPLLPSLGWLLFLPFFQEGSL